jgi:DNA invertase Pin-like site-specific DNA recombinase
MKRACLYIRVSTLDQHPETQLHELRQFASQRGFEIVDEYTDHGISGTKARRPALDRLLKDAHRHRFDVALSGPATAWPAAQSTFSRCSMS